MLLSEEKIKQNTINLWQSFRIEYRKHVIMNIFSVELIPNLCRKNLTQQNINKILPFGLKETRFFQTLFDYSRHQIAIDKQNMDVYNEEQPSAIPLPVEGEKS